MAGIARTGIARAGLLPQIGGALSAAALDATGKILTGTGVTPNAIVTIYVNGSSVGTTTANSSGAWTYAFGSAPAAGAVITYASVTAAGTVVPMPPVSASVTFDSTTLTFDSTSYTFDKAA